VKGAVRVAHMGDLDPSRRRQAVVRSWEAGKDAAHEKLKEEDTEKDRMSSYGDEHSSASGGWMQPLPAQ